MEMMNSKSFMDNVIKFEEELFNEDLENDIENNCPNVLDYPVFRIDEDNEYFLYYDRSEGFYGIWLAEFETNGGDYKDSIEIERYPTSLYNREFLVSRIVGLIAKEIEEYQKRKEKAKLIRRLINHDNQVMEGDEGYLVEFVTSRGFVSLSEYYYSLTDEELRKIEEDYFGVQNQK